MNNRYKTICIAFLVWTLVSCGERADKKNEPSVDSTRLSGAVVDANDTSGVVVIKDSRLQALFQQYAALSAALVNGKDREAAVAANALEAGARNMREGEIAGTAAKIVRAEALVEKRVQFATLSKVMIDKIKKAGLHSGTLYVDFCPMALDDKRGYWLSTGKEIRNPYFGDEMLACGSVEDSIR